MKSVNGIYEISSLKKSNISKKLEKREPKMYYSIYIHTTSKKHTNLDIPSKEELISNCLEPYLNYKYFYISGFRIHRTEIKEIIIKETDFSLKEEAKKREEEDKDSNTTTYYENMVMFDKKLGTNITDNILKEAKTKIDEKKIEKDRNGKINENKKVGNKVFIVHGHDNGLKEEIARFIEKLGLEVIILHEQANNGNTIIEKFEKNANEIGYAIILYTPCDKGFSSKDGEGRARQNVIFEHGFFIGKLGRKYVAAIKKDNVEVPSDLSGILYIEYDTKGAWKFELAKEMKGIGFNIDLNHIYR